MMFRMSFTTLAVIVNILLHALRAIGDDHGQTLLSLDEGAPKHRIAIIGAGAGGSSAAFHLAEFHRQTPNLDPVEIDIFEVNSYIGGRTITINALNDPRYPTEVGASIFVKINHVLYNLTQSFNLSTREKIYESTGAQYDLGIWDGSTFLFTTTGSADDGGWIGNLKGYWDVVRLLWRYGLSPVRTIQAKNNIVGMFLKWYEDYFPIANLGNFANAVGLAEYTGITGDKALYKNGVSDKYAREVVQSATRVNYAQNLNSIHGLETMVCMAADGGMSINGGNWRIFDKAIERSGATLHLNTSVLGVHKTSRGTYQIRTTNTSASTIHDPTKQYNTIILAAPYQFANITFIPPLPLSTTPDQIDYVTNHVTLFTSPYRPSPEYFNVESQNDVPDSILTTLPSSPPESDDIDGGDNVPRGKEAVGRTTFWSLSTLRVINPSTDPFPPTISAEDLSAASKLPHNLPIPPTQNQNTNANTTTQYLYKIFSPAPITASFISDLFNFNHTTNTSTGATDSITALPSDLISWTYLKIWQAYPYLPPTLKFAPVMLDARHASRAEEFNAQTRAVARAEDAHAVFYTSGVESFISTMETSALMGRNVARVVVGGLVAGAEARRDEL